MPLNHRAYFLWNLILRSQHRKKVSSDRHRRCPYTYSPKILTQFTSVTFVYQCQYWYSIPPPLRALQEGIVVPTNTPIGRRSCIQPGQANQTHLTAKRGAWAACGLPVHRFLLKYHLEAGTPTSEAKYCAFGDDAQMPRTQS